MCRKNTVSYNVFMTTTTASRFRQYYSFLGRDIDTKNAKALRKNYTVSYLGMVRRTIPYAVCFRRKSKFGKIITMKQISRNDRVWSRISREQIFVIDAHVIRHASAENVVGVIRFSFFRFFRGNPFAGINVILRGRIWRGRTGGFSPNA